jgi:hypothetical protein
MVVACTTLGMHSMLQNCELKNTENGQFYVMYFSTIKKFSNVILTWGLQNPSGTSEEPQNSAQIFSFLI